VPKITKSFQMCQSYGQNNVGLFWDTVYKLTGKFYTRKYSEKANLSS